MRVFSSCLIVGAALCVVGCGNRATSEGGSATEARVVLEVRPPAENADLYIATQAELARGDEVLAAAAEALSLADKWGVTDNAAAAAKLAPMVTSARVGDSALIELVVTAADETASAEIANAVAKAFVSWSMDEEEAKFEKRRDALQEKIEAQKKKLEGSRQKMLDVMEQHKITDLGAPDRSEPLGQKRESFALTRQVDDLRTKVEALMDLDGDQLIEAAVDLGIANPALNTHYPKLQNLKLTKAQLSSSGLASKHPKVVAVDRELTEVEEMLVGAVDLATKTLKAQLEMSEISLENQKLSAKAVEEDSRDLKLRDLKFQEAKAEYERLKGKLAELEDVEIAPDPQEPVISR
jgi:uncharacterized protein involved in exopolysaccharide biosynthesis